MHDDVVVDEMPASQPGHHPGIWHAYAAGFRLARANFSNSFVALGVLSAVAAAVPLAAKNLVPTFAASFGAIPWLLVWAPWHALLLSGQIAFSLKMAQHGQASLSQLGAGLRAFRTVLWITLITDAPFILLGFVEATPAFQIWDAVAILAALALLPLLPRYVCAMYVAVSEHRSTSDSLQRIWLITRGHWWRLVFFAVVGFLFYAPFLLLHRTPILLSVLSNLIVGPTLHLSGAVFYLGLADAFATAEARRSAPLGGEASSVA